MQGKHGGINLDLEEAFQAFPCQEGVGEGRRWGQARGEDPKMKVESCHAEDGSHQLATGYDYRRGADVVKLPFSFFWQSP